MIETVINFLGAVSSLVLGEPDAQNQKLVPANPPEVSIVGSKDPNRKNADTFDKLRVSGGGGEPVLSHKGKTVTIKDDDLAPRNPLHSVPEEKEGQGFSSHPEEIGQMSGSLDVFAGQSSSNDRRRPHSSHPTSRGTEQASPSFGHGGKAGGGRAGHAGARHGGGGSGGGGGKDSETNNLAELEKLIPPQFKNLILSDEEIVNKLHSLKPHQVRALKKALEEETDPHERIKLLSPSKIDSVIEKQCLKKRRLTGGAYHHHDEDDEKI